MDITRRQFSLALRAAALQGQPRPRPNIVLLLADDLGYGDLGCYGQEKIRTPNLDRMAREGIRFTQAYAGSTVCAPSRCALMTGLHTGHCSIRGNLRLPLANSERTVAEVLKTAGYRTALFGKWGLGSPGNGSIPNRRGFDEFYGYLDQNHAHNSYPEHLWQNQDEVFLRENWFDQRKTFVPDQLAAKALEFAGRDSTQPFFLYWATTIPHANNELGRARGNGMEVPSDEPYSREDWPQVEKNYAAAVTRLDRDGGRLLDLLRQRGLDRNTLVIFSSDNGPHREGGHDPEFFRSSGPLRGIKRDLYEGGIRVPAIAWWPGRITPGRVVDTPWAFWDFPATAAELAGIPAPPGDGVSCAPLLDNATPARRLPLYWEFHEGGFAQAVREGDWKLVRQKPTFQPELYNLRDDPGERRNLAAAEPQRVAALLALLRSSRHPSTNFPAPGDPPSA